MPRLPPEIQVTDRVRIPAAELDIRYARSGGPGGQHVNKTSTKVLMRWNVRDSAALDDADRAWLLERLASKLTEDGDLLVTSERHRDQARNVDDAMERFVDRVREALRRPKKRKKTKPSRAARQRRLDEKKRRGAVKRNRKRPRDGRGED
jgi:ribosome-associated protein